MVLRNRKRVMIAMMMAILIKVMMIKIMMTIKLRKINLVMIIVRMTSMTMHR